MGRMTRTQISLDERQYRFAKRKAAELGISLSAYLRSLIDERIEAAEETYSVMDLAGMFEDGATLTSREIDEILADEAQGIRFTVLPGTE
ncbi:MAG: hypothetical protein Kow00129_10500 [Thermoleophilia bacterium]